MQTTPRLRAHSTRVRLRLGTVIAASLAAVGVSISHPLAQVPGKNVNMVAGTTFPDGDPFLQRQNEPSIAVSSRNPLHLLAGANDYRTVDLPGLPDTKTNGDAWLGVFKSLDGGETWKSTLLPGYPQDGTELGADSPLKGYDAGADPVVRAGSNGLLFYSGIAFQRTIPVGDRPVSDAAANPSAAPRPGTDSQKKERDNQKKKLAKGNSREKKAADQKTTRLRASAVDEDEDEEEQAALPPGGSSVFVSTFLDLNNQETGDPIAYVRTTLVDQDAGTRFLDKQWIGVDIPRANSSMCSFQIPQADGTFVEQNFPGGRIYVAYTAFTGPEAAKKAQINLSYSRDCGATWSYPRNLSLVADPDLNDDGIANTADLNLIKASFGRRCGDAAFNGTADTNNDCIVNALDLAFVSKNINKSFSTVRRVPQGATIAIHPLNGTVYIAWREFRNGAALPDAIMSVRSTDFGVTFSAPVTVATYVPFDQVMTAEKFRSNGFPTMAADANRVYLAWAARGFSTSNASPSGESRIVMSTSVDGTTWGAPYAMDQSGRFGHQLMPALSFGAGKLSLVYYDLRDDVSGLFQDFIDETDILNSAGAKRHTIDVRIGQADPGPSPRFGPPPLFPTARLSQYAFGVLTGEAGSEQLTFNPPNLSLFKKGTRPFMGDYIDVTTSPSIRANPDGTWAFNIEPSNAGGGYAVWTDNRNVRAGPLGSLEDFTPPNSPARGTESVFLPGTPLPMCDPALTGTRNQDVFSARFDQGLLASAPGNAKPLSQTVQRAFAVVLQNTTSAPHTYRMTITGQPPGGQASFAQFGAPLTVLDVVIPRRSAIARSVYATSSDAMARIVIDVTEIDQPGAGGRPTPNGLRSTVLINGDPTNPAIENPAIENPAIENKNIESEEIYNPRINPAIENPAIENPAIENPAIENPAIENVTEANHTIINPAIENPAIENPAIENPAIENPAIENATLVNGAISDTTWELTNDGNTTAVYAVRLLLNQPFPPNFQGQLIIHKPYTTPAAAANCDLTVQLHNNVVVNITTPEFRTAVENPAIENPAIENATVALAPGETASVTLRVFDPILNDNVKFNAASAVTPTASAQSVNTEDAAAGSTTPPSTIAITILAPPLLTDAMVGAAYSYALTANVPGTWAVVAGALPPGLSVNAAGQITGTPTTPGTFPFIIELTDGSTPAKTASRLLTIRVGAVLAFLGNSVSPGVVGQLYEGGVAGSGGVGSLSFTLENGALPTGLILNQSTGSLSGTPTAAGAFAFRIRLRDSGSPQQTTTQDYIANVYATDSTDLTLSIGASQASVDPGDVNDYFLTVQNATGTAASGVVVTLTVPPGAAFESAEGPNCSLAGSLVTCTIAVFEPNSSHVLTIHLRALASGAVLNIPARITVGSGDTNALNNVAVVQTTVTGASTAAVWVATSGLAQPAISIINPVNDDNDGTVTLAGEGSDVAFSRGGDRAYVVHKSQNSVSVVNTSSNTLVTTLSVTSPVQVETTPDGLKVLVVSDAGSVSIFDALNSTFIDSVAVGDLPGGIGIHPNGQLAYVANSNSDTVSVIDIDSATVIHTITLSPGVFPVDVALTPDGGRLYVSQFNASSVSVFDTVTYVEQAPIGLGTEQVPAGPQGLAVTPDGRHLYVANFGDDTVTAIDLSSLIQTTISTGGSPNGIVASPDGNKVYVTLYNSAEVAVIDTSTNTVTTTIGTGTLPIAVKFVRIIFAL